MSILWIIRFSFIGILFTSILIFTYLLRNREKYSKILESLSLNFIYVMCNNTFCYLPVILPSDPNVIPNLFIQNSALIRIWFVISGIIIICIAGLIAFFTVRMRKAIGAQDTSGKLLTSGVYGFCRHPIYLEISLITLGIALLFNNLDGLLVTPLIIVINIFSGKMEEKYDIGKRFKEEYSDYKNKTRFFGPIWFWLLLIISILIPVFIELII